MKRSAPDHPKMLALQERLGCSKIVAVGILELLWHWAMRFAPQGNVGKWSDDAIARGIGWEGDGSALVSALVSAGWIDTDPEHRLLIHDWHEHADQGVKKSLGRAGLDFLSGHDPDTVQTPSGPPQPQPQPQPLLNCVSLAPQAAAKPAAAEKVVLEFPTFGDSRRWALTKAQVEEWRTLYPALNLLAECRQALAWIQASPDRRKTARGMKRFLVGWLNRSVNSHRSGNGSAKTDAPLWPQDDRTPNPSPPWQAKALEQLSSSPT